MMSDLQICTFWVGKNLLALRLRDVREITPKQPLTRVPLAPDEIGGLMNLRGDIVPTIDARRCLGLKSASSDQETTNVILAGETAVSLTVDEVGDIITIDSTSLDPPPDHVTGVMRTLVEGVFRLSEDLVLLVSGSSFLSIAAESLHPLGGTQ